MDIVQLLSETCFMGAFAVCHKFVARHATAPQPSSPEIANSVSISMPPPGNRSDNQDGESNGTTRQIAAVLPNQKVASTNPVLATRFFRMKPGSIRTEAPKIRWVIKPRRYMWRMASALIEIE